MSVRGAMLLVDADQQLVRQRAEEDLEVRYRSDADNWPRETVTRSLARGRLRRFQGLQRKKVSQYLEQRIYMCRRCTCRPKLEEDNGFGPGGPRCAPRPYQGPSQFAVDMINIKLHTHYPQRKSCPGLPRMLLCCGVC